MKRFAAIALLIAATGAASAQDAPEQTVEGAHRFLSILAGQRQLVVIAAGGVPVMANYWAETVEGDGCRTSIAVSPRAYQRGASDTRREAGQPGFDAAEFQRIINRHALPEPPFVVDWSKVSQVFVMQVGDNPEPQIVRLNHAGKAFDFYTPDGALAKRLEYAANFLKAACDPTAETGF